MTEDAIANTHRPRFTFVYLRQSSQVQVRRNQESTRRQYALADGAQQLGWRPERVQVVAEDLGLSGRTSDQRKGFQRLAAEVALGHAGLALGLEVSRLARKNADWYRLIEVSALTRTLLSDADGIYNPADFNDRLLLGLLCRIVHKMSNSLYPQRRSHHPVWIEAFVP